MATPLKLYLADDHQILIDGLIAFFHEIEGFEVIGFANDGATMLRDLQIKTPDIILLDLNMPRLDGIKALEQIKMGFPTVKVIILSNYHQTKLIKEAKEKGARGYLLKNGSKKELFEAIELVRRGGLYFKLEELAEDTDINTVFSDEYMLKYQLTKREVEIIKMVCLEWNSREISEKLFISESTVNTHRRNIFSKLDIKNTPALINFARANGIS